MRRAEFGDFTFNPLGIPVSDVAIVMSDVVVDPEALHVRGRLQIISIGSLRVNGIAIAATDLQSYIDKSTAGAVTIDSVSMHRNVVRISGMSKQAGLRFGLAIDLYAIGRHNIGMRFAGASIGIFPLPAFLLNAMTDSYNPLITGLDQLGSVDINELHIDNDTLRIGNGLR